MNLVALNTILKTPNTFAKTKTDYKFMSKVVLRNIAGNYDMPITGTLSSIEYKMAMRLVEKRLGAR